MSPQTKKIIKNFEAKIKVTSIFLMMLLVSLTVVFFTPTNNYTVSAASSDFENYMTLTTSASQTPEGLTDYPVLVYNATWLSGKGQNGFSFYDNTGTSELDWELEKYDNTTGELAAWVNISTLSESGTSFRLYYNDSYCESGGENNPTNVWANYTCVYHLDEASGTVYDSTTNDIDSIATSCTYAQTGIVGSCIDFDKASSEYVNFGDVTDFDGASELTVECWFDYDGEMGGTFEYAVSKIFSGNNFGIGITDDGGAYSTDRGFGVSADGAYSLTTTENLDAAGWHYLAMTYHDSNNLRELFYQGLKEDSDTDNSAMSNIADHFAIGCISRDAGKAGYFNGLIDEVRVSSKVRSQNWFETCYNNINNKTTFVVFGAVTSPDDVTNSISFGSNPSDYFTTSGTVPGSYYGNDTGTYNEVAALTVTINSGVVEYVRINVSDIDTNITSDCINISFSSDNATWGTWHQCTNGGENIIWNATEHTANGYMTGANPFSGDTDGDGYDEMSTGTTIYWKVRVTYEDGIGTETYNKLDMTGDIGNYS